MEPLLRRDDADGGAAMIPVPTTVRVLTAAGTTEREVACAARIWAGATARRDDLAAPELWQGKLAGIRTRLALPGAVLVVAQDRHGPTGFAVAAPRGSRAELFYLAVEPRAWGHGTATALLSAVERWATAIGAVELVLWVLDDNVRAHDVYARHGWTPTGERQHAEPSGRLEHRLRLTLPGRRATSRS
jgi:GNAT superfamily N-acetyltransferase